jgi:hypothetical protein
MMKKILIVTLIIAALVIMGVVSSMYGQSVTDFSGRWSVRWLDNDTRNPMVLTQTDKHLTGTYVNDKNDTCLVSGEYPQNNKQITLRIDCPKWSITMEGFPSLDGKTIVGKYMAYVTSTGGFIMTKNDNTK